MTLKRIYNLKTRRITRHYENLSEIYLCVFLVLFVICAIILVTLFCVKNFISKSDAETYGLINYHDVGNNEIVEVNNKLIQQPGVRNDYVWARVEDKPMTVSNTVEYTSTTIESPLGSTTISPENVPPRFLIVNTVSAIDISNPDFSTAGSTNDYVRIKSDDGIRENLDEISTEGNFVDGDSVITESNIIDTYIQWNGVMFNEESIMETDINERSTPIIDVSMNETCTTNSCKQSAGRMLALVNHTAEPCQDFYSYACGGFEMNHFKEFTVADSVLESLPGWKGSMSIVRNDEI